MNRLAHRIRHDQFLQGILEGLILGRVSCKDRHLHLVDDSVQARLDHGHHLRLIQDLKRLCPGRPKGVKSLYYTVCKASL
jgi:hypothetical protein